MPDARKTARRTNPWTVALFAAVAMLVAMLLVWVAVRKPLPQRGRIIGARLELVSGDVTVKEGTEPTKALSGTPLGIGSMVGTGKGARALVRTGDGAGVFLRGESEVTLGEHVVELSRGEIWLDAARGESNAIGCKAGAHTVTAADAGLSIALAADQVTVYVARGLATLTSAGGRVEVNAGEQAVAKASDAPKVSPVAFWQDWTGGMGDTRATRTSVGSGSGRIYGLDAMALPGAPALKLGISKQLVRTVIRDGIAETEVDQTFSNPGGHPIEGWYWFTLPIDGRVTSFALETDGVLVEGEVIERREAAAKYEMAKRTGADPALLEWVDGRSYRARIFPIPANGTRRVVLRYMQILPLVEGKTRYVYPLRSDDPVRFDEFSLSADLGSSADVEIATSLDATVEDGGRKVSMRRSGYVPRADFQLEMTSKRRVAPVRVWRFEAGSDQADYVMMRYVPAVDFAALPPVHGDIALVIDTSAGGDEGARQTRTAMAEALLRALSPEDRFALAVVDVAATVLYPKEGLAPSTDGDIAKALERLSDHVAAGATDLGAMFEPALGRLHGTEQPAIVYVGDGAPTSGEWTPEALTDRVRRSLAGSRARLFCVGVGSDARHDLMEHLARAGGGRYLRVADPDELTGRALQLASLMKTPTVTDIEVDLGAGLDQPFYSSAGRLSRGEELLLFARTHNRLPKVATIKGRVAGKDFKAEHTIDMASGVATSLVPRFWAGEYVNQLLGTGAVPDQNRAKVLELGLEYGVMTPYTSILALESEQAYARQGVRRRSSPLRGVRLTAIENERDEQALAALLHSGWPGLMTGCNARTKSEAASDEEQPRGASRAKGEEGAMGNAPAPAMPKSDMAPAAAQESQTDTPAHEQAKSSSVDPGVLGLVGGGKADGYALKDSSGRGAPAAPPAAAAPVDKTAPARPGGLGIGRADAKQGARAPATPPLKEPVTKDTAAKGKEKEPDKASPAAPKPPITIARRVPARCSDAASRPLPERIYLWEKRLKQASRGTDLVQNYELAREGCELPDWKDQAALLDLLQKRIDTEESAVVVLAHFSAEPEAQRFVARRILRRTIDTRLAAAVSRVLFGGKIDWAQVDRDLLETAKPEDRLEKLRKAMLVAPNDPNGDARLIRLLTETGQTTEALSHGRRMRDRGFMTPMLAEQLGNVLAKAGEKEEAQRTYSEIVEFDPTSPTTRRALGDAYLRHGWYASAYRQYRTLAEIDPKSATNWLRLAAAASGAGRIDEALRIEREVASGEGSPGPNDPRLWARLWSAARLGVLLHDPTPAGGKVAVDSLTRKLKELQLFSGPGVLALLTWEDLDTRVAMVSKEADKDKMVGEVMDAGASGLVAVLASKEQWERAHWLVRRRSDPQGRDIGLTLVVLSWDGKSNAVDVRRVVLKSDANEVGL